MRRLALAFWWLVGWLVCAVILAYLAVHRLGHFLRTGD